MKTPDMNPAKPPVANPPSRLVRSAALGVLALFAVVQATAQTTYFSADAESGTVKPPWGGIATRGANDYVITSTEQAHTGSRSYKMYIDSPADQANEAKVWRYENQTVAYWSYWWYIAQGYDDEMVSKKWKHTFQFKTNNGGTTVKGGPKILCGINKINGVNQLTLNVRGAKRVGAANKPVFSGYTDVETGSNEHIDMRQNSPRAFSRQQWVHIECYVKMSTSNGHIIIWQDGVKVFDLAHADFDTLTTWGVDDPTKRSDNQYLYWVPGPYVGIDSVGTQCVYLDDAKITNFRVGTGGGPPFAPSALSATAVSSSQINLAWQDNSTDETGFKIDRKTGAGGTYAQITTTGANVTSYNNTALAAGTNYYYRVRATNGNGDSAYSNEASATTQAAGTTLVGHWAFDESSGTTAADSSGNGNTGSLQNGPTWTTGQIGNALNFDATNDVVNCGSGATLDDLAALTVSAWIRPNSVGQGGLYGRIAAKGAGQSGGWQLMTGGTNLIAFTVDHATTNLVRNSGTNAFTMGAWNHVVVTWTGSATATNAKIYVNGTEVSSYGTTTNGAGARVSDSADNLHIGNISSINRTFDGKIDDVRVYNGVFTPSEIQALYNAGAGPPTAPSGLSATVMSSSQINLGWVDNSNNETGFKIERKTGAGGTYAQIDSVGADVTGYNNTGLSASTTYYYRVRATNANGDSTYSNEVSATTQAPPPPAAPSGLSATAVSSTQINLAWTDNSSDETGFIIERGTYGSGEFVQIATVGAGVTSYNNTGLSPGVTYDYRVCATNNGNNSAYSNVASAVTPSNGGGVQITDLVVTDGRTWNIKTNLQEGDLQYSDRTHTLATVPAAYRGLDWIQTATSSKTEDDDPEATFIVTQDAEVYVAHSDDIATRPAWLTSVYTDTGDNLISSLPRTFSIFKRTVSANTVVSVGANNGSAGFYTIMVKPTSLPVPWQTQDIGAVAAAGSASYNNGTFTVAGSGADIWGTADEFRYMYQIVTGDCEIRARVDSVENTHSWAKAGVMIRETLNTGSKHASAVVTPASGVSFQRRTATDGTSASTTSTGLTAPYWVRVVRSGNTVTASRSPNGTDWTTIGSETITMASNVYIGLAVTSHNDGVLCTSMISNVAGGEKTLVGHWALNEGSGTTAADSSGNGNTGTLQNGPAWTTGQIGNALSFDGADDVVNCGSGTSLANLSAITVAAWINATTLGENGLGRIASKAVDASGTFTNGWQFIVGGTNQLTFSVNYATTNIRRRTSANAISTGAWRHVAATWGGSTAGTDIKIYVNGVEVGGYDITDSAAGARADDASSSLHLGNNSGGTRTFNGKLDEVRIYNRALSPTEIQALYNAQ